MGVYNTTVITNAGQNLIASAIAGGQAINFTAVKTSTHVYPAGTALQNLTSLSDVKQTVAPTSVDVYNNNVVQISARVPNTGIATAYLINTIGLFGSAGGAETLIAVLTAQTPDEVPAFDAEAPAAFIFNIQMTIQNADEVVFEVNDTGTATVADLNRKVNLNGGDLSDTVVETFTAAAAEYPVPAAGDSLKVICGKIVKFCSDIVSAVTTLGSNKLDKTGDAQNATVGASTASTASYPIPAAGDSFKVILGKIRKFFTDIKAAVTGLSISGRTITWTKADGTTGTLTTQDTTYGLASTAANGLLRQLTGNSSQWMRGDGTWQTAQNNLTTTEAGYVLDARMGKTLSDAIAVRNSGFVDNTTSGVTVPATGAWTNVMFVKPTGGAGVYLFNVHLNAKTENDKFTGVRIYIENTAAAFGGVILNGDRAYHDTRIIALNAADVTGRIFVQVSCLTACTFEGGSWGKNVLSIIRLY